MNQLQAYAALMRMDRPIGSWLLAWPAYWALLIASQGEPTLKLLVVFTLGVFVMRSAGCVINDFADRHIDGHVKRTQQRPLATGAVAPWEAVALFILLLAIALALVLTLNTFTIYLSFIAASVTLLYPFTKRWTHGPQFILGIAFSMPIPMAFAATISSLPWVSWVLFIANFAWIVAYDTQYAMVDRDDDLEIGVKSTAILAGQYDRHFILSFQLGTIAMLALVGWFIQGAWAYFIGVTGVALGFIYQAYLTYQRERQACFQAFLHNHYVGMFFTLTLALHYWLPAPLGLGYWLS